MIYCVDDRQMCWQDLVPDLEDNDCLKGIQRWWWSPLNKILGQNHSQSPPQRQEKLYLREEFVEDEEVPCILLVKTTLTQCLGPPKAKQSYKLVF